MFIFSFIIIISNLFSLHFFNINTHSWYIWITNTCIKNTITCKCMLCTFVLFCLCFFFKNFAIILLFNYLVSCSSYIFFQFRRMTMESTLMFSKGCYKKLPRLQKLDTPSGGCCMWWPSTTIPWGLVSRLVRIEKFSVSFYHVYLEYMYIHTSRDLNEWCHVERDILWSNHAKSSNIAINSLLCSSAYM